MEIQDSLKILGVIIDSNLTFEEHLKTQLDELHVELDFLFQCMYLSLPKSTS